MALIALADYLEKLSGKTDSSLLSLLTTIATTVANISHNIQKGALAHLLGASSTHNIQGEVQQTLDIYANEVILSECAQPGIIAGIASEEMKKIYWVEKSSHKGSYLLLVDPLDGSSNIAINAPIGSIFSIVKNTSEASEKSFLQRGKEQVAACYGLYGPQTFFALTLGQGVDGFTLNQATHTFFLTHPKITISPTTCEFAINMSNQRYWEKPVQRYIHELVSGQEGPRGKNFNMRWVASMVADVHRILMRGGVFAYPKDRRNQQPGKLRLLYEANPMAFLIEQAGGLAHNGQCWILEIQPQALHERVAVFLGAQEEVEKIAAYHKLA